MDDPTGHAVLPKPKGRVRGGCPAVDQLVPPRPRPQQSSIRRLVGRPGGSQVSWRSPACVAIPNLGYHAKLTAGGKTQRDMWRSIKRSSLVSSPPQGRYTAGSPARRSAVGSGWHGTVAVVGSGRPATSWTYALPCGRKPIRPTALRTPSRLEGLMALYGILASCFAAVLMGYSSPGGSAVTEMRAVVWPVYLVADESGSMEKAVPEMNEGLRTLLDTLQADPMKAAKARFCVIGFDHEVRCHLALSDLRHVEEMPTLSARGTTAYSRVFSDLRRRIDTDVSKLRAENYGVNRPVVFFLSDGVPNEGDPWKDALEGLKDPSFTRHPNILTFGLGDADPTILIQVATATHYAFVADAKGADTGRAITEFFNALTRSMENSTQAMGSGKAELQIQKPEGFTLAVDLVG